MTTQISVETLSPITHNQIPVITTELLAQLYGAEFSVISEAVSLFPQFSCGMMILLFPLSHGWNWREPMVGLLFAEINWWKG